VGSHANLGTASIYLHGIDTEEIIATVHARHAPMMSASVYSAAAEALTFMGRDTADRSHSDFRRAVRFCKIVPGGRLRRRDR
jgi:hypothetical protein